MTNTEILTKAIQKAIDGGWRPLYGGDRHWDGFKHIEIVTNADKQPLAARFHQVEDFEAYGKPVITLTLYEVFYRHDFARALFGEGYEPADKLFDDKDEYRIGAEGHRHYMTIHDQKLWDSRRSGWEYHLQQMVIAEDPIKYLGANLPVDKSKEDV